MKQRLDVLLVEQGHAASREKAKAMIMSGVVFVNGQREDKAEAPLMRRLPQPLRFTVLRFAM